MNKFRNSFNLNLQLFAGETLESILGDELYSQVVEKLGDKKVDIVSNGNWIPKAKFDDINIEKKEYKDQVDSLNIELGKLQNKLNDNEDANKIIEDLKTTISDKEKEMELIRKSNAIKLEVLKANPNDVADILPHLKNDLIQVKEDGIVEGLKEQLDSLKENKSYLFKLVDPVGTGGSLGNGGRGKQGDKNPFSKEHFNLTEQGRLIREEPELAIKLRAEAQEKERNK